MFRSPAGSLPLGRLFVVHAIAASLGFGEDDLERRQGRRTEIVIIGLRV